MFLHSLSPPGPVYIAARFYQRFVYIHPFNDGNGRISRFMVVFLFITPLRRRNLLELKRFLMQERRLPDSSMLPDRHM
ncbi:MAG: Fic family protein [Candidatus Electrothrix sp. MAN1_4]|nr:Fic family protein [Candidatus Electrothrix sp. MAN1_4]